MTTDDPSFSSAVPLTIRTADGIDLEGLIALPENPNLIAVVCHPHPLHGGSMHTPIGDRLMAALPQVGVGCLQFNFRSVGGSGGMHGYGDDEQVDIAATIDAVKRAAPGCPIVMIGWSFGADLSLTSVDPALAGWFLIAPPLRSAPVEDMGAIADPRPKVLAIPAHDQFNPPKIAEDTAASWTNATVEVIEGIDHFLTGKVDEIAERAVAFAQSL